MAIQNDDTLVTKGDLKNIFTDKIAPYLGASMMLSTNNSDYYTTTEKIVGVWTDGRPLYQITYNFTMPAANVDYTVGTLPTGANTKQVFGGIEWGTGSYIEVNYYDASAPTSCLCYVVNRVVKIIGRDQDLANKPAFVTVKYTKSSDAAGSATATPGCYDVGYPNTWPENKEVYLKNGVYGYRATGNYTTAVSAGSNTWTMVADKSVGLTTNKPILSYGGNLEVYSSSGVSNTPACVPRAGNFNSCIYIANAGTFRIQAISPTGSSMSIRTTDKYDVWITYTK